MEGQAEFSNLGQTSNNELLIEEEKEIREKEKDINSNNIIPIEQITLAEEEVNESVDEWVDESIEGDPNLEQEEEVSQEGIEIKQFPRVRPIGLIYKNLKGELILPLDELIKIIEFVIIQRSFKRWANEFSLSLILLKDIRSDLESFSVMMIGTTRSEDILLRIAEQLSASKTQIQIIKQERKKILQETISKVEKSINKMLKALLKIKAKENSKLHCNKQDIHHQNQIENAHLEQAQRAENQQPATQNNEPQLPNFNNNNNNNNNNDDNNNNNDNIQEGQAGRNPNIQNNQNSIPINNNIIITRHYTFGLDLRIFNSISNILTLWVQHFDLFLKVFIMISCSMICIKTKFIYDSMQQVTYLLQQQEDPFLFVLESNTFDREVRIILANLTALWILGTTFLWRRIWKFMVNEFTDESKRIVKSNSFRFCAPKHLLIIKMLDENLLNSPFEVFVFFGIFCQANLSRLFNAIIESTMNNLEDNYENQIIELIKMRKFNRITMIFNLFSFLSSLIIFSTVNSSVVIRLSYGMAAALLSNFKIEFCCQQIISQKGKDYYTNLDLDQISKPTLRVETAFTFVHEIFKLYYLSFLATLFFTDLTDEVYYAVFLLYYLLFGAQSTIKKARLAWSVRKKIQFFQQNLDELFPKQELTSLNSDEVCSICHDELLNKGRKLKDCSHAFHLRCISKWIQTQQVPRCPNCRLEIKNVSQLRNPSLNRPAPNFNIQTEEVLLEAAPGQEENVENMEDHIPSELFVQPLVNL